MRGGQFAPEYGWSACSGKEGKNALFRGGQFGPFGAGQFDRIFQSDKVITLGLNLLYY
jgi:hypothetical protein